LAQKDAFSYLRREDLPTHPVDEFVSVPTIEFELAVDPAATVLWRFVEHRPVGNIGKAPIDLCALAPALAPGAA
jgi:hypothetical protein